MAMVERIQPQVYGSEQVFGFSTPPKGTTTTPKEEFTESIMSINRHGTDQRHFSGTLAVKLNSNIFMEGSRPRRAEQS